MVGEAIESRVAMLRKRQGLTQRVVASRAGTDVSTIGKIESGDRMPGFRLTLRLATALNTHAVALFSMLYEEFVDRSAAAKVEENER